eukprot:366351-Chlamydomonas_euryale.AAC.9
MQRQAQASFSFAQAATSLWQVVLQRQFVLQRKEGCSLVLLNRPISKSSRTATGANVLAWRAAATNETGLFVWQTANSVNAASNMLGCSPKITSDRLAPVAHTHYTETCCRSHSLHRDMLSLTLITPRHAATHAKSRDKNRRFRAYLHTITLNLAIGRYVVLPLCSGDCARMVHFVVQRSRSLEAQAWRTSSATFGTEEHKGQILRVNTLHWGLARSRQLSRLGGCSYAVN